MSDLQRKLKDDSWSLRAIKAFDVLGLVTYADLCARQASEFRVLNNFGNKSFKEIEAHLASVGLKFATEGLGLDDFKPSGGETAKRRIGESESRRAGEAEITDTPTPRHPVSTPPPTHTVPAPTNAPPSLRYKFAGESYRVDKFAGLALEFGITSVFEDLMEFFHATIAPYARQWQIVQRLYGITPLLLPEGANVEDYRPLTHLELGELMGITLPQLQQELSAVRTLWRNAVEAAERAGEPANRRTGEPESADTPTHRLSVSAASPAMTLEEGNGVLSHYGFDPQIFERASRTAEVNAFERAWFLKRLSEFQKELDEPKASGIARELLLGELYMRRIDAQAQMLDPVSISYAKSFSACMELKNDIQLNYLKQLTELDNSFPYKSLIGGKASFKGVVSEIIDAVRDFQSLGDNALVNKINTAGEVEIGLRQSLQAPEARWRLGKDVFILEAIHPTNLNNPNYKSQYSHRQLKKLDLIGKRVAEEVRRELDEDLVDLEKDGEEGEYHELRENQTE